MALMLACFQGWHKVHVVSLHVREEPTRSTTLRWGREEREGWREGLSDESGTGTVFWHWCCPISCMLCVSVTFVCHCVLQTSLTSLMVVASGGCFWSWDGFQGGT